jgi:hypothetical protein
MNGVDKCMLVTVHMRETCARAFSWAAAFYDTSRFYGIRVMSL